MNSQGYLLCCFDNELYFKLTERIISNIRLYDNTRKICILTNNINYFNNHIDENIIIKLFDYNNHLHPKININNTWNRHGLIPKVYQSLYTPFDITMFLDVDMIFYKDFTYIWQLYNETNISILCPGFANENNRSPSHWHWGGINNIMSSIGINVPQVGTTLFVYNNKLKDIIIKDINNIFNNLEKWNVLSKFRNGYPDEIIYAIILGYEKIRPHALLHDFIYNINNCDAVNKIIKPNT